MEEFNNMQGITLPRFQLAGLLPLAFSCLLFLPTWQTLAAAWLAGEQDNTHAFPAFLAAVFIALTSQFQLRQTTVKQITFLTLIALTLCGFYITTVVNIELASQFLMIIGLSGLFVLFFGFSQALKTVYILLLILMALPIWDAILEPLVSIASAVVTFIVDFFNITVLIEGNSITTPYGRILIAEGCSGIRYLMVSLILSVVVSHINNYQARGFALTIALGLLLGLIANWLRILTLVFVGYFSKMQSGLMADHELFGWVIFALFVFPAMYFAPHSKDIKPSRLFSKSQNKHTTLLFLLALAIGIHSALFISEKSFNQEVDIQAKLGNGWTPVKPTPIINTLPNTLDEKFAWFKAEESETYIATFTNAKNTVKEKLAPYMVQSLVSDYWFLEQEEPFNTGNIGAQQQTLKSLLGNQRFARVQLFNTGGKWSSQYATAKLQQVSAILSGNNYFHYYLFLQPCEQSCDSAFSDIHEQIKQVVNQ